MASYTQKRYERGTTLHHYRVTDDDVRGFGEWLLRAAVVAGLGLFVAVVRFGYRPDWLVAVLGWV